MLSTKDDQSKSMAEFLINFMLLDGAAVTWDPLCANELNFIYKKLTWFEFLTHNI